MHIPKKGDNKKQKQLGVRHVWRKQICPRKILFGKVEESRKKRELSY